MNIVIPKGFKIGCAQDEFTGVTVILSEKGAMGGADCRGARRAHAKRTFSVPKK